MKFNLGTVRHLLEEDGWPKSESRAVEGFYLLPDAEKMLGEIVAKAIAENLTTARVVQWVKAGLMVRRLAGHVGAAEVDDELTLKIAFYAAEPKSGKVTMYGYMVPLPPMVEWENSAN